MAELAERDATRAGFLERYAETSRSAAAFVAFLCRAIDAPF